MGWASIIPAADPVDSAVAKILVPLSPQSILMTLSAKASRQSRRSQSPGSRFSLFTAIERSGLHCIDGDGPFPFRLGCAARLGPLSARPVHYRE